MQAVNTYLTLMSSRPGRVATFTSVECPYKKDSVENFNLPLYWIILMHITSAVYIKVIQWQQDTQKFLSFIGAELFIIAINSIKIKELAQIVRSVIPTKCSTYWTEISYIKIAINHQNVSGIIHLFTVLYSWAVNRGWNSLITFLTWN